MPQTMQETLALAHRPYTSPMLETPKVNTNFNSETFQNLSRWCSSSRSPSLEDAPSPSPIKAAGLEMDALSQTATFAEGDLATPVFDFEDELDFGVTTPESLFSMGSDVISTNQSSGEVFRRSEVDQGDFDIKFEAEEPETCTYGFLPNMSDEFSLPQTLMKDEEEFSTTAIRPQDMHLQNDDSKVGETVAITSNNEEIPIILTGVQNAEMSSLSVDCGIPLLLGETELAEPIQTPDVLKLIDGDFDLISYVSSDPISVESTVGSCTSDSVPSSQIFLEPATVVLEEDNEVQIVNINQESNNTDVTFATRKRIASFDEECSPPPAKRRGSKNDTVGSGRRKTKRKSETQSYEKQRYREMRDKNNEASRKSRQSRRERDAEMQDRAEILERENKTLLLKIKTLESLRDTVKQLLFKSVGSSAV